MKVLVPVTIDDSNLLVLIDTTNDPRYPSINPWAVGTTYVVGDRVRYGYKIYESLVAANLGNNPSLDLTSAFWGYVSATNMYKAFDSRITDQASNLGIGGGSAASLLEYAITPNIPFDSVLIVNAEAYSVEVEILRDTSGPGAYSFIQEIVLADLSGVKNYDDWYKGDVPIAKNVVFENLAGMAWTADLNSSLYIRIKPHPVSPNEVKVGEIMFGKQVVLGKSTDDYTIGTRSFSIKDRDDFGNPIVVKRPYIDKATFNWQFEGRRADSVSEALANLDAVAAAYFLDATYFRAGALIFGILSEFSIDVINLDHATGSMDVEGLT